MKELKIFISPDAVKWFKEELKAISGDTVRFYARYGGSSPVHDSFSLGVTKDRPFEPTVTIKIDDILFFIEERDEWYFNGHDLYVEIDRNTNELAYKYKKA